ncbi:MAG: iron ABC transporter permease [Lentisphaerales bacterium]|nr:MAG: iron ABC transporter permease [Lentisphaerales bacterium]
MKLKPPAILALLLLGFLLLAGCLLFGASGFGIPTNPDLRNLRLARVLAGFVVGAALSCAGVTMQAILRNPLAEPYVLGVSSGAGLGAAIAVLSGLASTGILILPASAFVFATLTLVLVFVIAERNGHASVYSLILSGVIIGSICSSILMFLVSTSSAEGLRTIIWWMLGSLQVSSYELLTVCAVVIAVGIAGSLMLARELDALTLGRETAHYVGVRTSVTVAVALGLVTLLAATSVSLAGLIGFVGLIVPHAVRSLVGASHRRLLPCAAIVGGVFLAVCDAAARTVLDGRELPIGVITAVLGGPFFLWILRARRRSGWIE